MDVTILSCSLNLKSHSAKLAEKVKLKLANQASIHWFDLREYPLPLCDGGEVFLNQNVAELRNYISLSHATIIATPIYNYSASASAKNCVELAGKALNQKIVSFLAVGGGMRSYMAIMPLANALMLDYHCLIFPKFIYCKEKDFDPMTGNANEHIEEKIETFCGEISNFILKLI